MRESNKMQTLLEDLSSLGFRVKKEGGLVDPPSFELMKEMWSDISLTDPSPRLWVFSLYLEKNYPEYMPYLEWIWNHFPNKDKFRYRY